MSFITSISVQHVRVHRKYLLQLDPRVTLITGINGSGKTTLLEALYIALRGVSFKGLDAEILQQSAPWYRVDVQFEDGTERVVKFDPSRSMGRKQFIVDGKTSYRLSAQHKYPVVLFEPDDLRLLSGSPARRRQFIDQFVSQLDPKYSLTLRRYERALKQRNTLLKQRASVDSLFAWDVSLSEYGAYIIEQRIRFIDRLNDHLNSSYASIAHTQDVVSMSYSDITSSDTTQKLLSELHTHTDRDRMLGYTSVGPHRHDLLFYFNKSPALTVASRGEARSIILALKFLEVAIIESMTGKYPVVLLDDVFSELDKARQDYLIDSMKHNQIIITSATHESNLIMEQVIRL